MTYIQADQIWQAALGQLQLQVTRPSYETWLKDTVGISHQDGEFIVGTPNAFVAEMLEQRMYALISQTMEEVTKSDVDIRFQVMSDGDQAAVMAAKSGATADDGERTEGLKFKTSPSSIDYTSAEQRSALDRSTSLNPRYTFDSFIVGSFNELAHAAALAVSEKPGQTYNPLFINSDVGLGKTHLLHAIGHRVRSMGLSLIYVTTEEFTNDYIKAIREGRTDEFRDRYRSTDVLLLDDIQFLIGKEQTQEGFFHTFNVLHMTNRQIVITSDRPTSALTLLEDRVRSRLSGGLVVDVQPPDLETRLAILRAKADQLGHNVAPEVINFLGERIHKNVRELEGTLNRVIVYSQITQSPVNLDLVKRAVADAISPNSRRHFSPDNILEAVSTYFQVDQDALKGPRGKKAVALARQVAMYLLREEVNLGPTMIGRILGGKDHSTVVKNCAKITRQIEVDSHLRRDVINIRDALATE